MLRYLFALVLQFALFTFVQAQTKYIAPGDSAEVRLHPAYSEVSNTHRKLFGENYRAEWASTTRLPLIKISSIAA